MDSKTDDHLRNILAANAHDAWSRWTTHLFAQCSTNEDGSLTIPPASVQRWKCQIATTYDRLSAEEQSSDLREADLILQILRDSKSVVNPQPKGASDATLL